METREVRELGEVCMRLIVPPEGCEPSIGAASSGSVGLWKDERKERTGSSPGGLAEAGGLNSTEAAAAKLFKSKVEPSEGLRSLSFGDSDKFGEIDRIPGLSNDILSFRRTKSLPTLSKDDA